MEAVSSEQVLKELLPARRNIPRPIFYPFISELQKAFTASFLNPAKRFLYFSPLHCLRAMRSAAGLGRRQRGPVPYLVTFDQMHVPQLLLFEFNEGFGAAAKRLY